MENLFLLAFLVSIVCFIIGMIKPKLVVKWGEETTRTRKKVCLIYGILTVFFFVAFGLTTDVSTSDAVMVESNKQEEIKKEDEEAIKEENKEDSSILNTDPEDKTDIEEIAYKNGTYKVGTDMPSGEYLVIPKGMGYVEVSKDSKGTLESILYNDAVSGNTYISIEDGEYVKLQSCIAYPIESAPSIIPEDGLYKDGVYKVGVDIPAGEYKTILTSTMGYIEVTTDRRGGIDSIVSNDVPTGDSYITVENGQYLKLQGVEIQK